MKSAQHQQSKVDRNGAYRVLPLPVPNHIANQRQSTYYNIHNDRVHIEARELPCFVNTARRQHGSFAV